MEQKTKQINKEQVPSSFVRAVKTRLLQGASLDDVSFFSGHGVTMAVFAKKDDDGNLLSMEPLGCPLCILPEYIVTNGGKIMVSGRDAIPLSAVSEDTSINPAQQCIALCPDCGRPIVDQSRIGVAFSGKIDNETL